jgi:hypothetical protein
VNARVAWIAAVIVLASCVREPVQWGDVSYRRSLLGDPDTRSAVMSANLPVSGDAPGACLRSIRSAGDETELFRVWWAARNDSSVTLLMQRSSDGGRSWLPATVVDSRDLGGRGCERPAPGIFFDKAHGYLDLVYFIEGSEGAGVFFSHSMDNGGMFHSPVPVVFGNVPSAAAIAANGDSVVVVFEDPNATTPRIGIVLSTTTGHIFDQRAQVTPDEVPAITPWVALAHDTVTVWWKAPDQPGTSVVDRVGYRSGVWR